MKTLILLNFLFSSMQYLSAQAPASYSIQQGEIIINKISLKDTYRFASFQRGNVLFTNGSTASSQLNYNYLYGEMQFIDVRGDTLSIAPRPMVKYVSIGDYGYYYYPEQHKYLEVIEESSVLTIAIFRHYQIFDQNKQLVNGFVDTDRTFNEDIFFERDNRSLATSLFEFYHQESLEPLRISYQEKYFFIDHNTRFYPAVRTNLWKIFPEYRQLIRSFVNKNKLDFSQEDDLIKLVSFCEQLTEQ